MCNVTTDAICDRIADAIREQWSVGSDRTVMTLMVQQAVRELLEATPEPEPVVALVTVDDRGHLTPKSTVSVGEQTWPVPGTADHGGVMWWPRVGQVLKEHGLRPKRVNGQLAGIGSTRPGVVAVRVEPIETNEQ